MTLCISCEWTSSCWNLRISARPSGESSLRGSSEVEPAAAAAEGEEGKEPSDCTYGSNKKYKLHALYDNN